MHIVSEQDNPVMSDGRTVSPGVTESGTTLPSLRGCLAEDTIAVSDSRGDALAQFTVLFETSLSQVAT